MAKHVIVSPWDEGVRKKTTRIRKTGLCSGRSAASLLWWNSFRTLLSGEKQTTGVETSTAHGGSEELGPSGFSIEDLNFHPEEPKG